MTPADLAALRKLPTGQLARAACDLTVKLWPDCLPIDLLEMYGREEVRKAILGIVGDAAFMQAWNEGGYVRKRYGRAGG